MKREVNFIAFLEHIEHVAHEFKNAAYQNILFLHHNDTDGLSSAAVILAALERSGIKARSVCLEKPYPVVLKSLFRDSFLESRGCIVFADFGSGMLPTLEQVNVLGVPILLLDHHGIKDSKSSLISLVNPRSFQIDGSRECSASSLCALFAQSLSSLNVDLLRLGVLGACGDGHFGSSGELSGVNDIVFRRAESQKLVSFENTYMIQLGESLSAERLKHYVDSLGGFGYFEGGPDIAIKGLLEGFDGRYVERAEQFYAKYENALNSYLSHLHLETVENCDWFFLNESFSSFGVKTVGLVTERIAETSEAGRSRYVIGFQDIPAMIPGIGMFEFNEWKLSFRATPALTKKIFERKALSLAALVPPCAEAVGGFVDACHDHAAACTVPHGKEEEFLNLFVTAAKA